MKRELPYLIDYSVPAHSSLLNNTLLDFLPDYASATSKDNVFLPAGHHLVYFAPRNRLSSLLHDGTDPLHSPGPPFTRRMWAGGSIEFRKHLRFSQRSMICNESIDKVDIKGRDGDADQKIFVEIKRRIRHMNVNSTEDNIVEIRRLVFMHESPRTAASGTASPRRKIIKPPNAPDFFHTLRPSPGLLFRFSALSLNDHAIHLDRQYCQYVEGRRNLLVHGPLSLVLMLRFLKGVLLVKSHREKRKADDIKHIEYRNLAPLYAEEEMKICVRQKDTNLWETWIEDPEGGYAVKGTVKTGAFGDGNDSVARFVKSDEANSKTNGEIKVKYPGLRKIEKIVQKKAPSDRLKKDTAGQKASEHSADRSGTISNMLSEEAWLKDLEELDPPPPPAPPMEPYPQTTDIEDEWNEDLDDYSAASSPPEYEESVRGDWEIDECDIPEAAPQQEETANKGSDNLEDAKGSILTPEKQLDENANSDGDLISPLPSSAETPEEEEISIQETDTVSSENSRKGDDPKS